jgi:hypothetical protein
MKLSSLFQNKRVRQLRRCSPEMKGFAAWLAAKPLLALFRSAKGNRPTAIRALCHTFLLGGRPLAYQLRSAFAKIALCLQQPSLHGEANASP